MSKYLLFKYEKYIKREHFFNYEIKIVLYIIYIYTHTYFQQIEQFAYHVISQIPIL